MTDNFYNIDFTLDSIRDTYHFEGSCQGSVPQALAAFFESTSFEDAIRNVISIGGDCDTTGAITGSLAWIYYAIQTGSYGEWCDDELDPAMLRIKENAKSYLPNEFIEIADEFHEICWKRAGMHFRSGYGSPILSEYEGKQFMEKHEKSYADVISEKTERIIEHFCNKYITMMDALCHDRELNAWCRQYSADYENTVHKELEHIIYDRFVPEAYGIGFMHDVLKCRVGSPYSFDQLVHGSKFDMLHALAAEIRRDCHHKGSLINDAIADGKLYRVMASLLKAFEGTSSNILAKPDAYSYQKELYVDDM